MNELTTEESKALLATIMGLGDRMHPASGLPDQDTLEGDLNVLANNVIPSVSVANVAVPYDYSDEAQWLAVIEIAKIMIQRARNVV